jgi:hypothetical protein
VKKLPLTPDEANRLIVTAGPQGGGNEQSPAKLRQRSLALLAYARRVREDAQAARLRSIELRTKAQAAGISASALRAVSAAAARRNDNRHSHSHAAAPVPGSKKDCS